ncbi:glycosyltransferase family 2 protein [Patescibacteria group bacterium]|nr:glycosyltransferase family 2 protein [Patescibacteria group bacterium]
MISLLVPVFNEEAAIADTLKRSHDALSKTSEDFEIVVINDGSTDGTTRILQSLEVPQVTVINHPYNKGYGASIKTGIRKSKGNLLATTDADGTYPIDDFPILINNLKQTGADMVIGARIKKGVKIPLVRRPAKAIVALLANTLTGIKIPDNNSGMRIFTRELGEKFMHLYPQRFSFTMTLTVAALTNDYSVEFVPIDYFKRVGKSSLSSGFNGIRNFLGFLGLIIRITTYFRPLRFFAWPSAILMLSGFGMMIDTIILNENISDAGMLLLLTGLQIGLFGILAEVIVRYQRAQ